MSGFASFVLVPMVYLAVVVFVAGVVWHIRRVLGAPALAQSLAIHPVRTPAWPRAAADALFLPTVRRHNLPLWAALMVFHAGLVLLFIGHLELIADVRAIQAIPHTIFLGKGAVGVSLLLCILYFLARRLVSPTKDLSVPEDYLLLALLFLIALSGAQMNWARTWYDYATVSVPDYRAWLWGLITFSPRTAQLGVGGHSFLLVVHVFLANLLLMIFPFTKLMHFVFTFALNAIRRA